VLNKLLRSAIACLFALPFIHAKALASDNKASSALSHYIMGVMYEDLGDIDKAIEEYTKAAKADNDTSSIHLNLASSYIKKSDFPKAIEELKIASLLSPEAIEPHAILAILYSSQNKLDLATAEYEAALKNASKLDPRNTEIYKGLGAVYLQGKKLKEAEGAYRMIIELAPNDAQAHFYLGSIYSESRNSSSAEKELIRAIELKPDYHEALNFLGYTYVEENRNLIRAEGMIKKALQLDPNNGAYVDSLGWLYFKQRKYKEALKELERAASLIDDPVILDHLGDAYQKLNEAQKSRMNWEKSLKLDPNQEQVKKKLEKIK